MIALCAEHHKKADAGTYTIEQLRGFKRSRANAESVQGTFDWLRNDLLVVAGGSFYYETLDILEVDGHRVLWFRRDDQGYLRLNVSMLSLSPGHRASIQDNFWSNIGEPEDLRSPPSGKVLEIRYSTGDYLSVKFFELTSAEATYEKYQREDVAQSPHLRYPITAVEVNLEIASAEISLTPNGTTLPGNIQFNLFSVRSIRAFVVNRGLPWRQNTAESSPPQFPRNAPCPCKSGKRYKSCHGVVR